MGGVVVGTVHLTGTHHADRRLVLFHHVRLYGRSVRTQKYIVAEVESILHIARGVVLGDIQLTEIIKVSFHLGTVRHAESQRGEYGEYLLFHERARVETAAGSSRTLQGDVYLLFKQFFFLLFSLQLRKFFVYKCVNLISRLVDQLADGGAFFRGIALHSA